MTPSFIAEEKPRLLLFDVYGTLLDMEFLERKVNSLLDNKRGYAFWFELFVRNCCVANLLNTYNSFASLIKDSLRMSGEIFGEAVSDDKAEEVLELFDSLPLYEGVTDVFTQLYDQGFRIAALTNAPKEIIESRMERTGLISYFEAVLSAEEVKKYKPAPEVYQWAAERLVVPCADILLVTTHDWDIAGAANAGMKTAYMRKTKAGGTYPFLNTPNITLRTMEELTQVYA